ncbi:MAG TPA: hypothetical protein VIU12_34365 [Chryseolinea sp.]
MALAAFLAFSCASTYTPVVDDREKPIVLPMAIGDIEIVDQRTDTTSGRMNLPMFAAKPKAWMLSPTLTPELKKEFADMIRQSGTPGGPVANITLYITEGYYRIEGDYLSVSEQTSFVCVMELVIPDDIGVLRAKASASTTGGAAFTGTEEHARKVYQTTAKDAVKKALWEFAYGRIKKSE